MHLPLSHSTRHGINSLLFRRSLLWNNLPSEIKESLSTEKFKKRLKDELLSMDTDVSIHQRYLRFLVTEVFKSVNNLNPHFMREYFKTIFSPYDLGRVNTLQIPPVHSTRHGINSLLFRGSLLWK